ncbi:MAG: hypothetical protein EG828_14425, partial [Deltaproteobacteria bacterium]|nr:hypothetical protein [Deltaproteobacteria bacterium]
MLRKSGRKFGGFLSGTALAAVCILCLSQIVFAGVSLDGSPVAHGRTDTLSGPAYIIDADMGTQKGANLFHSLRTFNIGTGEFALFT